MLAFNYRVAQLDPRRRLMLDFAWKLTTTPHLVDDSDRDALSQQGLSQEDIFDLAETINPDPNFVDPTFELSYNQALAIDHNAGVNGIDAAADVLKISSSPMRRSLVLIFDGIAERDVGGLEYAGCHSEQAHRHREVGQSPLFGRGERDVVP